MQRLFYLDSGLRSSLGHHANSCRSISAALRRKGVEVAIVGCHDMDPSLVQELGAIPHFRANTYWLNSGDPICGWLEAFLAGAELTRQDLAALAGAWPGQRDWSSNDMVYFNSIQAAQLYGLAQWLQNDTALKDSVHAVVEFGVDPGLDLVQTAAGVQAAIRDPRTDPRATLYRFVANQMPEASQLRLHLASFDPTSSAAYSLLMGRPVATLPVPRARVTALQNRIGKRPVTVSAMGHQRGEKGAHLLPEIVRRTLALCPDIRFLVHNGDPGSTESLQIELRKLVQEEPRLALDERLADHAIWSELLARTDLILLPYDPSRFAISYSALACEGLANGIPMVAPARTTMARLLQDYSGCGVLFEAWNAESIAEAIAAAAAKYDQLAQNSVAAAERWAACQGPEKCAEAILRMGQLA